MRKTESKINLPKSIPPQRAHPRQVAARFSAAAASYAAISSVQDRVARQVMALVPPALQPDHVLDAGCGPGRLLALARERWPRARLEGVDVAPGMVREARALFAADDRVCLHEADLTRFQPREPYDLILSGSVLHWLRPFDTGLARVAGMLRPGGILAAGVMLAGTLDELGQARQAVAPHKAPPGRLPTFAVFSRAVEVLQGCPVLRLEEEHFQVEQPSAAALLQLLNGMGVTGGDVSRGSAALTRGELQRLAAWYEEHFGTGDTVRASFVVGYLVCERRPC